MKIDYVIVSSNDNPTYLDFWETVRDTWIKIGIKPILVLISDIDEMIDNKSHIIHKIKKVHNIDTGFQAQISRMYISRYYKNNILLTSDIDMIPLSKSYFNNIVSQVNDDSIAILSSDAYSPERGYNPNYMRHPICYNVAKGETFCNILDCDHSFDIYCEKLFNFNWGWDTDELYFGMMINKYNNEKICKFKRGWSSGIADKRIDRVRWNYDPSKINSGYYIDCHSLRPFKDYQREIQKIVNLL